MEYSSRVDGQTAVISMRGDLKFTDNVAIRAVIKDMKGSAAKSGQLDLSGLATIDSAGLGMLLLINDAAQELGMSFSISGANGQVRKMLDISKFNELMQVT